MLRQMGDTNIYQISVVITRGEERKRRGVVKYEEIREFWISYWIH